MKDYIETFKRLYKSNKLSEDYFMQKLIENKINQEEYNYILSK